jgi:hypothetical protein
MGHETEAACLLRTGAQYGRRVGLQGDKGDLAFLGVKHGAVSLYFGDEPIYHFDLEGRWQRVYAQGTHYRKSLDGQVVAIDRVREGENLVLHRRTLSWAETSDLDETVRATAISVLDSLGCGGLALAQPPAGTVALESASARELLERIAGWDAAAWFSLRERYLAAYGALPFLPPDCHQSVVLQATLGHVGGVAFGGGPVAEHYVRTVPEFADHVRAVASLFGRRAAQSRNAFIAGSDALSRPIEVLEALFTTIARVFPMEAKTAPRTDRDQPEDVIRLRGIDAFLDNFDAALPDRDGWSRLRAVHLGRVNLGVESGSSAVRHAYRRTWRDDDLRRVVADLKAAGVELGLILLVGAGGREFAESHLMATADLANSLELSQGDLVYLIDAGEIGALAPDLTPLSSRERLAQESALKERLEALRASRGAKVIPYNPEKQWN